MKLFNNFCLKFEQPDWSCNPEFGLIDTILDEHPELYHIAAADIISNHKSNGFGRGDIPSVEQIIRAAIYKELKAYDYRELEYAQTDSPICANFIKLDLRKPFSYQMFQKYISRITVQSLQKLLITINQIAINEGFEDIKSLRIDSTVVKTNIHYPTNNALIWDCIKESHRLLSQLSEATEEKGNTNMVFNKVVGSLKSQASSKNMETMLKRWRSGIEAVISNYKRKFEMFVCNWKGKAHFDAKVLWSAIAYNIRVMTRIVLTKIALQHSRA